MKLDLTPVSHAGIAVLVQLAVFAVFSNPWVGALAACTWWVAREHTQAEYRWISQYAKGKRLNMPWWGGFDPRAWDVPSLLDFIVPIISCSVVYLTLI